MEAYNEFGRHSIDELTDQQKRQACKEVLGLMHFDGLQANAFVAIIRNQITDECSVMSKHNSYASKPKDFPKLMMTILQTATRMLSETVRYNDVYVSDTKAKQPKPVVPPASEGAPPIKPINPKHVPKAKTGVASVGAPTVARKLCYGCGWALKENPETKK